MTRRSLLWVVYSCALAPHAYAQAPPPVPTTSSGSRVNATLVACDGIVDCWLARGMLPASWSSPRKSLTVDNVIKPGRWTIATDARDGYEDMAPPDLVTLGNPTVSGGRAILPITIDKGKLSPGHYVGSVRVSGMETDDGGQALTTADIPLDIRVRSGPLCPLLWLAFGVVVGMFLRWWTSKGERLAKCLTELDALVRVVAQDAEPVRTVLEPMLREVADARSRAKVADLEASLTAMENRRGWLLRLERLRIVLPSQQVEIERIRSLISAREDKLVEPAIAQLQPKLVARETTRAPVTSTSQGVPLRFATVPLWFTQHVAGWVVRGLLIAGAVYLGFTTLYYDGGATYGASPLQDGIALFVWGLGAEISTRSFGELGRVLAPKVVSQPTPEPPPPASRESAGLSLPKFEVKQRAPSAKETKAAWPGEFLQLAELNTRGLDGSGVRIGVIDTGVATEEQQPNLFHDRIKRRLTVRGGDGDDVQNHGTYMIGILASDVGITESEICSIRALDIDGKATAQNLVDAIDLAISENCDVISISAGQRDTDDALGAAVAKAHAAGIVVVAAIRGEAPDGDAYPAEYSESISVTPATSENTLVHRNPPTWVTVGAPGKGIPTYGTSRAISIDGSSPATAVVAGICARLLTKTKGEERKQLARALNGHLRDHADACDGGRLINVLKSTNAALGA